jgi:hypothetical protein
MIKILSLEPLLTARDCFLKIDKKLQFQMIASLERGCSYHLSLELATVVLKPQSVRFRGFQNQPIDY